MKHHNVDILIITNLPSFYKINLYNRIAKYKRIYVIYTGDTAEQRNADFFNGEMNYDYFFLGANPFYRIKHTIQLIINNKYTELVLGGWDSFPLWLGAFLSPKRKNALVVESSYLESSTKGLKGLIKRLFLSRISKVYASGRAQRKITDSLGFKGKTVVTKGVGVFNYIPQPSFEFRDQVRNYIYVGRLVPVKNLELLVRVFNDLPDLNLTIVGFGPDEKFLRSIAKNNITFLGPINNNKLSGIYRQHDVFVLPSRSEPWGLVVEEALNNGLPVIVSDRVGCAEEIVNEGNGLVFRWNDPDSLKEAILKMRDVSFYNQLRKNISKISFDKIEEYQVNSYLRDI